MHRRAAHVDVELVRQAAGEALLPDLPGPPPCPACRVPCILPVPRFFQCAHQPTRCVRAHWPSALQTRQCTVLMRPHRRKEAGCAWAQASGMRGAADVVLAVAVQLAGFSSFESAFDR